MFDSTIRISCIDSLDMNKVLVLRGNLRVGVPKMTPVLLFLFISNGPGFSVFSDKFLISWHQIHEAMKEFINGP